MISAAELEEFRADAESLMRDTCRITRPGEGRGPLDPETMQYGDPAPLVVYQGKCRIPPRAASVSASSAQSGGETSWQVGEYPLDLPMAGTEAVRPGQTVEYLSSIDDPALEGLVFGITDPPRETMATARHFRMKQTVGVGG